jgi:tyrosyl-tRNA synthetase
MPSFIEDLKSRGLVNNITNEAKLQDFEKNHDVAYVGFDPSGSSLHLGNYVMLLVLRRLKMHGHKTIAVIGGATGQIGDPSGKKSERVMLDVNTIQNNISIIKNQIKKFAKTTIFNNNDIYKKMSLLTFLKEVGKVINVNYLLEKDIISSRLNSGISFTEFSYSLIQAYDFL